MKPEEPSGEHGERDREPADNVVQLFPRDWLGPTDQLVPLRPYSAEHEGRPSPRRRGRGPGPRRISGPAGGVGGDPAAPDREAGERERSEGMPPRHLAPVRPGEEPGGEPAQEPSGRSAQEPSGRSAGALWNADGTETPDEPQPPLPAAGSENRGAGAPLSAQSFWSDAAPLLHDPIKPVRPREATPASTAGRSEEQRPKRRPASGSVARALSGIAVLALVALTVVGMVGFPGQVWQRRSARASSAAGTAGPFTAASSHHPLGGLHAELLASGTATVAHQRRADRPRRRDASHRRSIPHVGPRAGAASGISESVSSVATNASAVTTSSGSSAPAPAYGSASTIPAPTGEPAAAPATAEAAAGGSSGAGASTASGPQGAGAPFGPGQLN